MSEPTGSAPAGGMPAGGGMPSAAPAGEYAPAPGVVSPAVADAVEEPEAGALAPESGVPAGQAPAEPAAAPGLTPLPPTPQQAEIAAAAQHYYTAATQIQQELPQVQARIQVLEGQLAPYAQNPALLEQLPPELQWQVRQGYQQWQQAKAREGQLQKGWGEVQQAAPMLQTMYALEQRTAMLNQVGEPVAYDLLARRAAQRSGDPNFPVEEMVDFLKGTPANILEAQAGKYEALYKKGRLRERAAGMVDSMGPGGGGAARSRPQSGRDMIQDAINAELRVRPPR